MDDLIAAAIHDAKNDLNSLVAWLDRARRENPADALDQARAGADRINARLVALLALYREQQGTLRLAVSDRDMADFLADMAAEWRSPPDLPQVRWPARSPVAAWAFDAYQVKLALFDALRNAQRFARSRVELRVEAETGGGLRFIVADDGPGYPEPVTDKPMDADGSGLGLAFARLIAARHRRPDGATGRIEMKNAPTGGALFSLILP